MFVWCFVTVTEGLEKHQPEMFAACQRWFKVANQPAKLAKVLAKEYPDIKKISIDYALMEKAQNVIVADGAFEWDDLGSWTALARHLKPDAEGNCAVADFIHVDGARNIIYDARTKNRDADCRGRFARFDSGADGRRGVAGAQKPGAKGQGTGQETRRGCEVEEAGLATLGIRSRDVKANGLNSQSGSWKPRMRRWRESVFCTNGDKQLLSSAA